MGIKDKQLKPQDNNKDKNLVKVFYSWQNDDKKSKNYISKTLKEALEYINNQSDDGNIAEIDRDTQGIPGSPNIPSTIEEKISSSQIYIGDISVIANYNNKAQINQNVMYETGYAIAKLGDRYCILLHNSDNCEAKDLPFDISHRRLLIYSRKNKTLKDKLLEILPIYIENARLKTSENQRNEQELNTWETKILELFGSMSGEKRMIVSKAGETRMAMASPYDIDLETEIREHEDPQEIRASFKHLEELGFIDSFTNNSGSQNYRLQQKGYNYLKSLNTLHGNNATISS